MAVSSSLCGRMPAWILLLMFLNGNALANQSSPITEYDLPKDISAANSLVVDDSGRVWFAEKIGKSLVVFDPKASSYNVYPLPVSWGSVGPLVIAYNKKDSIYFTLRRWAESSDSTNIIGKFNLVDNSYHKYSLPDHVVPEELSIDNKGNVWFLSPDENRLYHFNPVNLLLKHYTVPTKYAYPRALDVDQNGNIWFAESNANKLAMFEPGKTIFHEFEIPTPFANPGGVAVDNDGKVWFVELTANRIGVYYPKLKRFDEALIPTPRGMPNAIKVDSSGKIWFLEHRGNKVGMFDPVTATFSEFDIPAFNSQPGMMAIDHQNGAVWFSESNTEVKKLGRLSINAALNTKDEPANSSAGILSTDEAQGGISRQVYIVLLLFILVVAVMSIGYSRKRGLKK